MHRTFNRRPSAATIISLVALFVALGGTGYAAVALAPKNTVGSAQVINGSLQKIDLSKKARAALKGNRGARGARGAAGAAGAAGATGAAGANGTNGAAGAVGATGPAGAPGAKGTAVAYADFDANGAIQANTSPLNLSAANMDHIAVGVYCLKGLSFTPKTGMVSADNSFSANATIASVLVVTPGTPLANCNIDEFVRVRTTDAAGVLANRPFNIWLE